ncbi:dihydrolipoamide acetyltransferase family protein [Treponema primitia]|uniref:dihydrolipoamide acetyltransferase family protein n=1 Tax=Treponema primitia TaxID=88058 RepID=UPI0002554F4F|nr:dihydrolipoamide acetyltransferase family protein [Treponema primitia]
MAHVLIMPRQGNTVESCILVEWKVKEGDSVDADSVACVVETDKATFEVPAGETGTVLKLVRADGDDVPVLEPIAVIGKPGEDWAAAVGGANAAASTAAPADTTVPAAAAVVPVSAATPNVAGQGGGAISEGAISPRARHLADKEGLPTAGIAGTGPDGRIIERDIQAALQTRPALSAAAKAALAAGGGTVPASGSGLGGRVTAADLTAPGTAGGAGSIAAAPVSAAAAVNAGEGAITETPIKGIRKLIADRMHQSLAESAQFTLSGSAPAVRLQELRARMKGSGESLGLSKITVNDLILYAVSRTLPRYPFMNALKIGDTLKTFERVHLGVAVDTPRGLMVPVIRNANLLSLQQISGEAKRLAAACQGSGVKPDELSGSTFTVTNLGSLGVSNFTPVLNAPEVGILGVCNIELKPVEADEEGSCGVQFLPHIGFSLTINHQVVDGAPAAKFLKALGEAVANIDLTLAI